MAVSEESEPKSGTAAPASGGTGRAAADAADDDRPGEGPRLGALLVEAAKRLREASAASPASPGGPVFATPELDARLLLAEATGNPPAAVHRLSGQALEAAQAKKFAGFLHRRLAGEPVHRIIGRRAFYEHDFALSPETLEPRPETEFLVEVARPLIDAVIAERGACLFADVGTGTGAIAVSLLALCPQAEAVAIDIAEGALVTARQNAHAAGVAARFMPVLCDHLAALGGSLDLLVSNPPYIPSRDIAGLDVSVRRHDPLAALDGGADGLVSYRAIAAGAAGLLRPGGAVVVEIGQGQAGDVEAIFAACGFLAGGRTKDLAGIERILVLTLGRG
ncbi:peptide chain release factor N(5)-glutamine methyltransferase [Aurantimonas sp. 22II-16-19i]|uniref:peptide chain release factor N(5)-glutamine methyltransferase n=1 Tax=Aurantimonas sp. 22II-16-19i TaxID=1317114 RepID=UPI0009F7EA4C|nr:peptide chain release factor N(5)-glutamine methyltransferase [Aurantimonas sp. 22II-16-19i]ORE97709.1 N5-glutamine S-adenosyl-L-methionine-dependent methyltransferase [Aurantimonas sp. 22II-16-19i]